MTEEYELVISFMDHLYLIGLELHETPTVEDLIQSACDAYELAREPWIVKAAEMIISIYESEA